MGTYSDNQKFYIIDPSEIVNVESDINYNLRRADLRVKALVEYQLTDVTSIVSADLPAETGFKWYKWYSNSIWNAVKDPVTNAKTVSQDANSNIDTWTTSVGTFEPGWGSLNNATDRIGYSISNGWVQWRGKLALTSGAELPNNTNSLVLSLPLAVRPNLPRYFFCSGGLVSAGFMAARVFIPDSNGASDPRMSITKYGANAANATQRYISLNDIRYPLSDVG
jgi:hypothetical protein